MVAYLANLAAPGTKLGSGHRRDLHSGARLHPAAHAHRAHPADYSHHAVLPELGASGTKRRLHCRRG